WRTLPVSKYICNLQGSFTPGSPAIGFHKSLDTTFFTKPMEICRKMLYNTFQKAQQRRTK
ncbi:MAG: hypothetical protein E7K27_07265, partial [[Clostridium] symbiosum]|nr:hypothetical protein [[Clostridium] symbiosum]